MTRASGCWVAWHDVLDALARLRRTIASADGNCRCGHEAGVDAACPCCAQATRDLAAACLACVEEIGIVEERLDRLEEAALRFLPGVFDLFARTPERYPDAVALDRSLTRLLVTFHRLRSATGEWARGCRTTRLPEVRVCAEDVATASRAFDDALRRMG